MADCPHTHPGVATSGTLVDTIVFVLKAIRVLVTFGNISETDLQVKCLVGPTDKQPGFASMKFR